MGKAVKAKSNSQDRHTNSQSSFFNMTIYEKDYIMSNLLSVLFEQVKLQQEVRDRWFGHYLTIIGALTAMATLCLKIFENVVQKENLYFFLGLVFIFACVLGVLFYILYLCQRRNYKRTYNLLSVMQTEIFKSISVIPSKLYEESTFTIKRHGADFYTLLIQRLIDVTMFGVGIVFLAVSQMMKKHITCIFTIIGVIGMFVVLHIIHYFYERREGKNEAEQNV